PLLGKLLELPVPKTDVVFTGDQSRIDRLKDPLCSIRVRVIQADGIRESLAGRTGAIIFQPALQTFLNILQSDRNAGSSGGPLHCPSGFSKAGLRSSISQQVQAKTRFD